MDKSTALNILQLAGVPKGEDFHRLSSGQVESLLEFADLHKYRKPKNANGSRGRYFHAYIERAASRDD